MAVHLDVDEGLVDEARKLGKHTSPQAAVEAALVTYVRRLRQQAVTELFGQVDFDDTDYKRERSRSPS